MYPSLIYNKFWRTQRFIEKWIISAAKTLNPLDGCNYQNGGLTREGDKHRPPFTISSIEAGFNQWLILNRLNIQWESDKIPPRTFNQWDWPWLWMFLVLPDFLTTLKRLFMDQMLPQTFGTQRLFFYYNSNLGCSSTLDRALMMLL